MIVSSNSEWKHLHTSDHCTNTFDRIAEVKMSAAGSNEPQSPHESKDDPSFPHEVTICLQCGDEGAPNAFVYCVYCLKYAVHRYCLKTLPETFDEFVFWGCDNCNEVTSSKDVKTGRKDHRTSSKHVENNPKKKHVQGKTGNMVFKSNDNAQKSTRKDKLLLHNGMPRLKSPPSGKPYKEGGKREASDSTAKLEYRHQQSEGYADLKEIDQAHNVLQSNKFKKRNCYSFVKDSSQSGLNQQSHSSPLSKPSLDSLLAPFEFAQPIIDQIWSGSFHIPNSKESDEEVDRLIVAHLSKKVGKQVFDEVKSFPSMLELELHPKAHLWPKRFQKLKPSDGDIAIYFFPLSRRYEGVFDELVEEMMDQELALKAVTENAELLVFPSSELPLNFWRFQGKYFLWGVFRGKQSNSSDVVSPSQ